MNKMEVRRKESKLATPEEPFMKVRLPSHGKFRRLAGRQAP
jgi:hypothetical protein